MSYRTYCQGVPFTTVHTYIIVLTSMPLYMYTKKPPDKSLKAFHLLRLRRLERSLSPEKTRKKGICRLCKSWSRLKSRQI